MFFTVVLAIYLYFFLYFCFPKQHTTQPLQQSEIAYTVSSKNLNTRSSLRLCIRSAFYVSSAQFCALSISRLHSINQTLNELTSYSFLPFSHLQRVKSILVLITFAHNEERKVPTSTQNMSLLHHIYRCSVSCYYCYPALHPVPPLRSVIYIRTLYHFST